MSAQHHVELIVQLFHFPALDQTSPPFQPYALPTEFPKKCLIDTAR